MIASLVSLLAVLALGYAVVAAISPRSGLLERLGLGGGVGLGVFTFLLFVATAMGLPLVAPVAAGVWALCLGLAAALGRRRGARFVPGSAGRGSPAPRLSAIDRTGLAGLLALVGFVATASLVIGVYWPVQAWDALTEYDFRGRIFAQTGSFAILNLDPYYAGIPLLTSLAHAWIYLVGGSTPHLIYWLYYVGLLVAVYVGLRRELRPAASLATAAALATTPALFVHSTLAFANLPFGYYFSVASIYLYLWRRDRRSSDLVLSGILYGLSSWTRPGSEPFVAGALLVLLATTSGGRSRIGAPGQLLALYLSFYLPWKLYQRLALTVSGDLYEAHVVLRLDGARLRDVLSFLWTFLTNVREFGVLWLVFLTTALVSLPRLRLGGANLVPLALTGWCLLAWIVQIYALELKSVAYLATASGERLLLTFLPLAVYACAVSPVSPLPRSESDSPPRA